MRLLHLNSNGDFGLDEYVGNGIPPYAILSHTWGGVHEEVTFKDLMEGTGKNKKGYRKITFCGKQAAKDKLQYFWVDTCCIDKSSSVELSEAIRSMFNWYKKSIRCYVYLEDVNNDGQSLTSARWFTRGWTLQELLAPAQVIFYSNDWQDLGNKTMLAPVISQITGINPNAIQGLNAWDYIRNTSVAKRMSWASTRETTREEDIAYCLLGLFNVNMPLLYGEGENAFLRLQEEIIKSSSDQSLLAWRLPPGYGSEDTPRGILANYPRNFVTSSNIIPTDEAEETSSFSITNKGLHIRLPVLEGPDRKTYIAVLPCIEEGKFRDHVGLSLRSIRRHGNVFYRSSSSLRAIDSDRVRRARMKSVYVLKHPTDTEAKPPLLWIAKVPAADSGIALVKYTASHGVWDEENRVIDLFQVLGDRWYKLKFETYDSSLTIVVSLDGESRDRESLYLADVQISRQSQAVSSDATATSNRQSTCKFQLSAYHTVSASIAWRVILGREVLVLEVKVLNRWQRHSIFTLSRLKYIGLKYGLPIFIGLFYAEPVFILLYLYDLDCTTSNFLIKPLLFEKIEYSPRYLFALSFTLTIFWFLDWNDWNWKNESAIPLLQTALSSFLSYYPEAIANFNLAVFFVCWGIATYVIALGWRAIAELVVLRFWSLKAIVFFFVLVLQTVSLGAGKGGGLYKDLFTLFLHILCILGMFSLDYSLFPSVGRFILVGFVLYPVIFFFIFLFFYFFIFFRHWIENILNGSI